MSSTSHAAVIAGDMRARIMRDPDVILSDAGLMAALIARSDAGLGGNVIDLRGIAMERLEARLSRLEETHRSVIAAAYENLAGMNQVHRAVLRMLDPTSFEGFLRSLSGEVADILRVESVRLVLETAEAAEAGDGLRALGDVLHLAAPGFCEGYVTRGRAGAPARTVALRRLGPGEDALHGEAGGWIASEACLALDFGEGRLPGLLVLGSEDPLLFQPGQGTDLLAFFGGVFERAMRRWLG